jgi:hypothetical protein
MALEEAQRNYERNRYYHDRKKLQDRIRMYPGTSFAARLQCELEALEQNWKARKAAR